MHPMLNIAIRAIRVAGDIIVRHIDHLQGLSFTKEDRDNLVDEIKQQAKVGIIKTLQQSYPQHAISTQEDVAQDAKHHYSWIVKPLDSTTNYLNGIPQYTISIALRNYGRLEQAVIYDPLQQELFTASRGRGAQMNNKRIRVSNQNHLKDALLGTSLQFKTQQQRDISIRIINQLLPLSAGIRVTGATSLDLAYVACARMDGFWGIALKPWDVAAGALFVQESGGLINDTDNQENYLQNSKLIAATPVIHQQLLKILSNTETHDI